MTKADLLNMLKDQAVAFSRDRGHYKRNKHMHPVTEAPSQDVVDTILTGFINHVGREQGVDYAMYASDLAKERREKALPGGSVIFVTQEQFQKIRYLVDMMDYAIPRATSQPDPEEAAQSIELLLDIKLQRHGEPYIIEVI